jgi:predicted aspartyl protease
MIPSVDGLLGVATLADWDVRIDPATKKLTLFPAGKAPPLEGETVLPLTHQLFNPVAGTSNQQGFRPMGLRVPVQVGYHELIATPDTGFGGIIVLPNILMEKVAPEAMKNAQTGLVTGFSMSGKAVSRQARLPEITFGPDTLRDVITDVINAPPDPTSAGKGLIGLNLLRHYVMTFRFATGELRLKPLGTVQEITQASTAGINMDPDYKILSVMPDGPADKAGLRAGDEVLEIEGNPLKTMTPEKFAALKRLPPWHSRQGELPPW